MCCCGKPIVNGQFGYRWQPNDTPHTYPLNPPEIGDAKLIYDEPGRCGGLDCHSHHFRLVLDHGRLILHVRHGGGDEQYNLSTQTTLLPVLGKLDSTDRYWLFHAIHNARSNAARMAENNTDDRWRRAAAEKRIKTRKVRGTDHIKVWIETKTG